MMSVVGRARTNASAPTLTSSETTLLTVASSRRLIAGWTYSRQMLRLKRLAAAIDMIAAGTRAPTAMAAKATPVNQLGNIFWKRSAMALLLPNALLGLMPAAMAMKPRSPISPSRNEYAGRNDALRLMTRWPLALNTPSANVGRGKEPAR